MMITSMSSVVALDDDGMDGDGDKRPHVRPSSFLCGVIFAEFHALFISFSLRIKKVGHFICVILV